MSDVMFAEDVEISEEDEWPEMEALSDTSAEEDGWDGDGESAEFIGSVIRGLTPPVISNLLVPPKRRPVPRVRTGRGVRTARLSTPRGSATLRLPSRVPTLAQFKRLESGFNRLTTRQNSTDARLRSLGQRVAKVVTDVTQQVKKARSAQQSQNTTNMLISMMMQQGLQQQLATHTHAGNNQVSDNITAGTNTALLLLPMMMGSEGEGGSDDNMMMMMMMMMMTQQNQ